MERRSCAVRAHDRKAPLRRRQSGGCLTQWSVLHREGLQSALLNITAESAKNFVSGGLLQTHTTSPPPPPLTAPDSIAVVSVWGSCSSRNLFGRGCAVFLGFSRGGGEYTARALLKPFRVVCAAPSLRSSLVAAAAAAVKYHG